MNLERHLARLYKDYPYFMEQLWLDRGLDKLSPFGEIEADICNWAACGPQKNVILAWRGFGKTTVITAGLTCWDLYRDPNWKTVIVSKSEGEAKKTLSLIRQWIEHVPFLQHLRPQKGQKDSAVHFEVAGANPSRNPSVTAVGVDGQLEGKRGNRMICDDVETAVNTLTLEARERLEHRSAEFGNITTYEPRRINVVGTFHHEDSLYLKLEQRGYALRTWPLLYPKTDEKVVNLAPLLQNRLDSGDAKPGDITAPYRITPEYVADKMADGRRNFAMQQMLIADLGDKDRYPLQLADLIVFPVQPLQCPISIAWGTSNGQGHSTRIQDIPSAGFGTDGFYAPIMFDEQWGPYNGTKMWIDPSGRGKDKTGVAIVAYGYGHLWVKHVSGLPGGHSPETLDRIASLAREHHVNHILVEDVGLQSMFSQLLEPVVRHFFLEPGHDDTHPDGWRCSVEMKKLPPGFKEQRIIAALEPVTSTHRLVVDRSVAENLDLQKQLTRIRVERKCLPHEDELEALANACWCWSDMLHVDPAKASQRQRDRLIDDELREMQRLAGIHTPRPRWFRHH